MIGLNVVTTAAVVAAAAAAAVDGFILMPILDSLSTLNGSIKSCGDSLSDYCRACERRKRGSLTFGINPKHRASDW